MKRYVILLIILSAVTHFFYFPYPNSVVFDEVYFGDFASSYTNGSYFFDIHPPLGKLLISAAGAIGDHSADVTNYKDIGNTFGDSRYIWYRLLPLLAGFLLPLIIYFLCIEIGMSQLMAFLAGLLLIFENSLQVQARFILLDSMLIFFGFCALLVYTYARKAKTPAKYYGLIALSALFATLSFSVKWTGLSFLGIIFVIEFVSLLQALWRDRRESLVMNFWRFIKTIKIFLLYAVIGFILYFLFFAIHFALLTKSGPGDAYMTPQFQKTLLGNQFNKDATVKPMSETQKFFELNHEMFSASVNLTATHSYGSKWYTWPLMLRGIFYWQSGSGLQKGTASMIYLLGNIVIYWLSAAAVLVLAMHIVLRIIGKAVIKIRKNIKNTGNNRGTLMEEWSAKFPEKPAASLSKQSPKQANLESLLIFAFMLNWLPFIFITRVAFLYHYEAALVMAIIILSYIVDKYTFGRSNKIFFVTILILSVAFFIYFAPLTYGIPMNESALLSRFWITSWR